MYSTQYGVAHPHLTGVIPLLRLQAQAICGAWPGATLVSRTPRPRRGITGTHPVWSDWEPVPAEPDAPAPPDHAAGRRRPARAPEDLPRLLAERYTAGDLDGVLELYETGAVLAIEDRQHVRYGALRDVLAHSIDLGLPMSIDHTYVLAADRVALLLTDWSIAGLDRRGAMRCQIGRSTDVVRADDDGRWKYAVDNPAGAIWPELPKPAANHLAATYSSESNDPAQPHT